MGTNHECHRCFSATAYIVRGSSDAVKPKHKFSCLPDPVDGLGYADYTTTCMMLTDSETPFTTFSIDVGPPDIVHRHQSMRRRIETIMTPFEADPCYKTTATDCMFAMSSG